MMLLASISSLKVKEKNADLSMISCLLILDELDAATEHFHGRVKSGFLLQDAVQLFAGEHVVQEVPDAVALGEVVVDKVDKVVGVGDALKDLSRL